jgi:hypothetical protein
MSYGECPLWVISEKPATSRKRTFVRYGPKADKNRLSAFVR